LHSRETLQCWRTHICGISDGKGVTSTAKTFSTAKLASGGGAGETGEAGVFTGRPPPGIGGAELAGRAAFSRVKDFESACPAFMLFDQVFQ
jgi:hypothetical protein